MEFSTLTREGKHTKFTVLSAEDVTALLTEGEGIRKAEEEAEKAKTEAKARERKAAK